MCGRLPRACVTVIGAQATGGATHASSGGLKPQGPCLRQRQVPLLGFLGLQAMVPFGVRRIIRVGNPADSVTSWCFEHAISGTDLILLHLPLYQSTIYLLI